jgi:hypothetical protein
MSFNLKETEIVYENLMFPNREKALINKLGGIIFETEARKLDYETFFNFYDQHITGSFIDNETVPHLIIETEGSFTHLDDFVVDEEIVDFLNRTGLHIYLKELPYFGLDKTIDNASGSLIDCSNFKDIETAIKNIKPIIVGFELTKENLSNLFCYEFEKISSFVENNNLTNVTVFCGQYKIDEFLQSRYTNIKLDLADLGHAITARPSLTNSFSFMSYNKHTPVPKSNLIEYKFWCSNKSYEGFRQLVAAFMLDKNSLTSYIHKNFDYSIFLGHREISINDCEFFWGDINNRITFDFNEIKKQDIHLFSKLLVNLYKLEKIKVLSIDKNPQDKDYQLWLDSGDWTAKDDSVPLEYYSKCFCAVVTESLFSFPFGNFCDKAINAIKCFRPFVLVGCPGTLEYMRKKGFKTFEEFWDEGYDQELDHKKRLLKIFKVIDSINNKSIEELQSIYLKMIPILEHNHKNIENLSKIKSW